MFNGIMNPWVLLILLVIALLVFGGRDASTAYARYGARYHRFPHRP